MGECIREYMPAYNCEHELMLSLNVQVCVNGVRVHIPVCVSCAGLCGCMSVHVCLIQSLTLTSLSL